MYDFLTKAHVVDVNVVADWTNAMDKMEDLFTLLCQVTAQDEHHRGEVGYWDGLMRDYFGDFPMMEFLSIPIQDDKHYDAICHDLILEFNNNPHRIGYAEHDYALQKIEDLNDAMNKACPNP